MWWTAKTSTARPAKNSTAFRNAASKRTPDLTTDNAIAIAIAIAIEAILPREDLQAFRGVYLDTAKRLKDQQGKGGTGGDGTGGSSESEVDQLDFEFVLFASVVIDYDYMMGLMARYSQQGAGTKQKMSREEVIGLIQADAKFMNERDDIAAYINTLKAREGLSADAIREGYTRFKKEKDSAELAVIATMHGLAASALQAFVDGILQRLILDGDALGELMTPLGLGWKARAQAETALITLPFSLLVLSRVDEVIAKQAHGFKASFVHDKKSDLVKVDLPLPPLPEQQHIASCLSSLDELISAESKQLAARKTHKKALMQRRFPSVEAVAA